MNYCYIDYLCAKIPFYELAFKVYRYLQGQDTIHIVDISIHKRGNIITYKIFFQENILIKVPKSF